MPWFMLFVIVPAACVWWWVAIEVLRSERSVKKHRKVSEALDLDALYGRLNYNVRPSWGNEWRRAEVLDRIALRERQLVLLSDKSEVNVCYSIVVVDNGGCFMAATHFGSANAAQQAWDTLRVYDQARDISGKDDCWVLIP